jgi:hypothetical protein
MKSKVVVVTAATLVMISLTITMLGLLVMVVLPQASALTPSIPIPPPGSIGMFHEQSIVASPISLLG